MRCNDLVHPYLSYNLWVFPSDIYVEKLCPILVWLLPKSINFKGMNVEWMDNSILKAQGQGYKMCYSSKDAV